MPQEHAEVIKIILYKKLINTRTKKRGNAVTVTGERCWNML